MKQNNWNLDNELNRGYKIFGHTLRNQFPMTQFEIWVLCQNYSYDIIWNLVLMFFNILLLKFAFSMSEKINRAQGRLWVKFVSRSISVYSMTIFVLNMTYMLHLRLLSPEPNARLKVTKLCHYRVSNNHRSERCKYILGQSYVKLQTSKEKLLISTDVLKTFSRSWFSVFDMNTRMEMILRKMIIPKCICLIHLYIQIYICTYMHILYIYIVVYYLHVCIHIRFDCFK